MNVGYAVSGSGRTFQLPMPRCFAVVASCPHHIATAPTYETREATGPKPCWWWVGRPGDCAFHYATIGG